MARRALDPEAARQKSRQRYRDDPEYRAGRRRSDVRRSVAIAEAHHEYYMAHRDRIMAQHHEYYAANRSRILAVHRAKTAADREGENARIRRWVVANPDKVAAGLLRRARREDAAYVEDVPVLEIAERDGWRCHICRKKVTLKFKYPHPMSATRDHLIPISRGGLHEKRNVKLAHWKCNRRRHAGYIPAQLRLIG